MRVYIYICICVDTRNFQQHRAIRGLLLTAFIINGTTVQHVVPPFKYSPNFLHSAAVDLPQNKENGWGRGGGMVVGKGQRFRKLNAYWHASGDRSPVWHAPSSPLPNNAILHPVSSPAPRLRSKPTRGIVATPLSIISRIDALLWRSFLFTRNNSGKYSYLVSYISNACRILSSILTKVFTYVRLYAKLFYSLEFDPKIQWCFVFDFIKEIFSIEKKKYCCINHHVLHEFSLKSGFLG